jgi:hypothetical protein
VVLPRWQGGVATAFVTTLAVVFVVLDITDRSVRRFWATHALSTDTIAGLLVLALTVLVVDQVVSRRQVADRSRAVAANAGIVLAQASRSVQAVTAARDHDEDRKNAADELRSYLQILMVGAPVFIEDPLSRRFLEQAQGLGGELARVLSPSGFTASTLHSSARGLEQAVADLRAAASPLLAVLTTDERAAVDA